MGKYVEQNLNKNEVIVKQVELNPGYLVFTWVKGILLFWLLLIPVIKAVIATIQFMHIELAVTNKRIVGKQGVFNTSSLDAPLDKIQNVSAASGFWGKIFNYGYIQINTAAGVYRYDGIKNADAFKGVVMAQIDQAEEDRIKEQAEQMAAAMSSVINK